MRPIIVSFPKTSRVKSPKDLICVGFAVNNSIFIGVDPNEPVVVDWINKHHREVEDWIEEKGYFTIFRYEIPEMAAQSVNESNANSLHLR